jgi:hypothetical protein
VQAMAVRAYGWWDGRHGQLQDGVMTDEKRSSRQNRL